VAATVTDCGYLLDGVVPWVTGADRADVIVLGGTLSDGRQILVAMPRDRDGVTVDPPADLLALSDSRTASVRLQRVEIAADELLAGPALQVLATLSGPAGGAGSLTTSALALGHAQQSLDRLKEEATLRPTLQSVSAAFTEEAAQLASDLHGTARGESQHTADSLRTRATSLALRASQAYLAAAKGAGFVAGHPAERLVREALFFLVWSCPQSVANNLLGEFSRCEEA
jgi:alkylation response protein AidB-like acyl-CoA dehydrogenase